MAHEERRQPGSVAPGGFAADVLDPDRLVEANDAELDAMFRAAETLPLDGLMNVGEHRADLAARTIYNDEHWKGYLPKGLVVRDVFARLSTGYAKRFWKGRGRYLGETLYVNGRIKVKHELEEFTLDRPTNDLDPGRYILLRYTDPVFELLFYDVFKALTDGIIVYRGYTGQFPNGKRGFTGLLIRRYNFGQMGLKDHDLLFRDARPATAAALDGAWRLDAVATSNYATPVADVAFVRTEAGRLEGRAEAVPNAPVLVPPFVLEHFRADDATALEGELRMVDDRLILGKWTTDIRGPYSRLLLVVAPGLFHAERGRVGRRRFTLHYLLTRR